MENSDTHTQDTYMHGGQSLAEGRSSYRQYGHSFADYRDLRHNPAVRFIKDHPLLCAAVVAAVLAIGPRRIARSAISGGTALTALTLRNQANVDMLGRLITSVITYMQRDRMRPPL